MTHTRRTALAGVLGTAIATMIALRRLRRVEVDGDSMRPTLCPGDRLLVLPTRTARPGHLVAVVDPRAPGRLMVKRVAEQTDGGYVVVGDNPSASTDSREFGPVPPSGLRGRVVYRYAPDERRGAVR